MRAEIRKVIRVLESEEPVDESAVKERQNRINEALMGSAPYDYLLKCFECGERFNFSVGEQQFYKQKGFTLPKRCKECRDEYSF
ncbi:zinc-ribbon domain containing protein [Bacillus sp. AK031]